MTADLSALATIAAAAIALFGVVFGVASTRKKTSAETDAVITGAATGLVAALHREVERLSEDNRELRVEVAALTRAVRDLQDSVAQASELRDQAERLFEENKRLRVMLADSWAVFPPPPGAGEAVGGHDRE